MAVRLRWVRPLISEMAGTLGSARDDAVQRIQKKCRESPLARRPCAPPLHSSSRSALLPTTAAMATGAIQTFERLSFQIDREREGFVRRARQQLTGGDALSTLSPSSYALKPGSAVCITGANDGIGRAAAVYLAKQGYATVLCARTQAKADEAVAYVQAAASGAQSAGVAIDLASFRVSRARRRCHSPLPRNSERRCVATSQCGRLANMAHLRRRPRGEYPGVSREPPYAHAGFTARPVRRRRRGARGHRELLRACPRSGALT